jgi:hypothetical protein
MSWLDQSIATLQSLSHQLDQIKQIVILAFMLAVQGLILVAFIVWAFQKCRALAKTLLGV